MSDSFWYILAGLVYVVINIVLWFYFHKCKAKGIQPKPAFAGFKKYERRITKWTDIFVIAIIMLMTLGYISLLVMTNDDAGIPLCLETTQAKNAVNVLLLFQYSFWAVVMISMLSYFQNNIILIKRLILLIMSCIPIVFGILYCIADKDQSNSLHLKLPAITLFCLIFINGPAILVGRPFVEFFPTLMRKIPLPWFQIPEENKTETK